MLEEYFQEVGLTLVELPIEFSDDRLIYRGYIKELPIINAEGETRKAMQQKNSWYVSGVSGTATG